jgi:threonylcarbamoyladenosine tRNA methylthiotransferase MtaB
VRRVRALTDQGFKEVVLTGVDLTAWGQDFAERPQLGDLVARILKAVPELPRLRLSSIDAAEIDQTLLRCLAQEPRLMPHLHLSLQAGDDMILKRMKRRHTRADALTLIDRVRGVRPDVAFGADLIAGFPTETEAMFENTLSLVADAGLAYVHAFPFSPRPGTPAARMPQLPRETVKARAERLRDAGASALSRHLDRQIGRALSAIVEKAGLARGEDFTDIAWSGDAAAGAMIRLEITGHDGRRAIGRPAG